MPGRMSPLCQKKESRPLEVIADKPFPQTGLATPKISSGRSSYLEKNTAQIRTENGEEN